jgi:hypothetical protein
LSLVLSASAPTRPAAWRASSLPGRGPGLRIARRRPAPPFESVASTQHQHRQLTPGQVTETWEVGPADGKWCDMCDAPRVRVRIFTGPGLSHAPEFALQAARARGCGRTNAGEAGSTAPGGPVLAPRTPRPLQSLSLLSIGVWFVLLVLSWAVAALPGRGGFPCSTSHGSPASAAGAPPFGRSARWGSLFRVLLAPLGQFPAPSGALPPLPFDRSFHSRAAQPFFAPCRSRFSLLSRLYASVRLEYLQICKIS